MEQIIGTREISLGYEKNFQDTGENVWETGENHLETGANYQNAQEQIFENNDIKSEEKKLFKPFNL